MKQGTRPSAGTAPTLPAPADDSPEAVRAVFDAVRAAAPELTREGVLLLIAQMSHEEGALPPAEFASGWVRRCKAELPMAWPAAMAGDALRFAHLMSFARHPKAAPESELRELMAQLHTALPS
jgi:hypothetical protein